MKKNHASPLMNSRTLISCAFGAVGVLLLGFLLYPITTAHAQAPKQKDAQLSTADARIIAEGIKPMVNDSPEGLVSVKRADGTISTDLQGRFQNVTVAKKDANGAVTQGCVNNTESAAGFFGIDRKLLGLAPKAQPGQLADR
jgi:hypothetical protein